MFVLTLRVGSIYDVEVKDDVINFNTSGKEIM